MDDDDLQPEVLDEDLSSLATVEEEGELGGSDEEMTEDGIDEDQGSISAEEDDEQECPYEGDGDSVSDDEPIDEAMRGSDGEYLRQPQGDERDGIVESTHATASPAKPASLVINEIAVMLEGNETEKNNEFAISNEKDEFPLIDIGFLHTLKSQDDVKSPQRHSKRIENRRPKSIYDENDYVLSTGRLSLITASSSPPRVSSFDPIREYFLRRLRQRVVESGGLVSSLDDWTVEVNKRSGAILGGLLDISYIAPGPTFKRHRSRVDSLITLGLVPYSKTIKQMSRAELADMAVENREKQLIAFQFDGLGNECREIIRDGDMVTVVPIVGLTEGTSAAESEKISVIGKVSSEDKRQKQIFFGFGNCTVLDWGKVVPDSAFHTPTVVYPLGFKCLRQEHDILLDRPVDCYCEVLSQPAESVTTDTEVRPGAAVAHCNGDSKIVPLFRISVCWLLGRRGDEKCVRVYEGTSPQLAWQTAMLERVGVEKTDDAIMKGGCDNVNTDSVRSEMVKEMEAIDEEEIFLRKKLHDARKGYMKAMRSAQLIESHEAAKPRLSITAIEHLFGDGILRLIEGMDGVFSCEKYEYVEMRSQESGFRGLTQAFSNTHGDLKKLQMTVENLCERVYLLNRHPHLTDSEIENGGPIVHRVPGRSSQGGDSNRSAKSSASRGQPIVFKKLKSANGAPAANSINGLDDQREEALRQKRLAARNKLFALRKIKARDMEKIMRVVRENTLKNTVIKRSEARSMVESACDVEESNIRLRNSPFYTAKPMWNSAYAGCIDISKGGDSNKANLINTPSDINEKAPRPRVVDTALDLSDLGVFRELEGDSIGSLLEVWSVLHSFSRAMNLQKIPSPQVFLHSLLSCDHNYIQNAVGLNKTINRLRDIVSTSSVSGGGGFKEKADVQLTDPLELMHALLPLDTPLIHQSEAESMLTDIAVAMCKMLSTDFNFWMGVDEAVGILGDLRPTVNALTWKEIARIVLTSTLLQEVKGDSINTATVLKGKGHTTAPDSLDKRTLRLSRRRLFAQGGGTDALTHAKDNAAARIVTLTESDYSGYEKNGVDYISREKYRAIFGKYATLKNLNAAGLASVCRQTTGYNGIGGEALGICVRLPTPGGCYVAEKLLDACGHGTRAALVYSRERNISIGDTTKSWENALFCLHKTNHYDRMAIRRILYLAIEMAVNSAKKTLNTKKGRECIAVSRLLAELLKEETSGKELKRRALLILGSSSTDGSARPLQVICPVSMLEAWEYQQRMKREPTATSVQPLDEDDASALILFVAAFENSSTDQSIESIVSMNNLQHYDAIVAAIAGFSVDTARLRIRYLYSLYQKAIAIASDNKAEDHLDLPPGDPQNFGKERTMNVDKSAEGVIAAVDLAEAWERDRINSLPHVVQKCFNVILELMVHQMATEFNYAVDFEKFPEFYTSIRHPLCFADVRQCLLENRYPLSTILVSFYRDVTLILENSLAYNPETDLITQSALKMGFVFERLFFEGILSVELSWMPEACIACRQVNCPHKGVIDKTEAVLCDRCDGAYHLSCLDPPLEFLPRGDWYCPACTHGKRVRNVHPCIGLLVHRPPAKPSSFIGFSDIGRVVDFRQIGMSELFVDMSERRKRFTMHYVVMFPKLRRGQLFSEDGNVDEVEIKTASASAGAAYELWSGDEVRQFSCRYSTGSGDDETDPVPDLPAGYNYADYDEACTIARGYLGWSSLSPGLHPSLSGACYMPMASLIREDSDMASYQRALVALSPLSCTSHLANTPVFGLNEWSVVLHALARRIINSEIGRDIANSFDEEATKSRMFSGSSISLVSLMCSLKGLFSGGPSVGEELVIGDKNEDKDGVLEALNDTDTDDSEIDAPQKPALAYQASIMSVASPVGVIGVSRANNNPKVELYDTETDSEGEVAKFRQKMVADEPFDESMLTGLIKDPRRDWNNRRLSRRRGREDALFTKLLLRELGTKVDKELAADMAAEKDLLKGINGSSEKFSLEYYTGRSVLFQTVSRLFVNQPPDSVTHPEEWLRSWTMCHTDNTFHKALDTGDERSMDVINLSEQISVPCCQFCGFDECSVGSVLVWGESREEFNIATYGSDNSAKDSFPQLEKELSIIAGCLADVFDNIEDLCNIWTDDHISSQKRRKLQVSFLSALKEAGRKCASSDNLLGEKKTDIVWAPLKTDVFDAEREEIEELLVHLQGPDSCNSRSDIHPVIRKGSFLVHERCAEYMNNLRKTSTTRLLRRNIVLVGELVTNVKRGKTVPIGCDSFGNIYWMLPGIRTSLFICVPHKSGDPESHYKKMFGRENNGLGEKLPAHFPPDYCSVNRCMYDDIANWTHLSSVGSASNLPYSKSVESPYSQPYSEDVCSWRLLNGIFDIHRLMKWLRPEEFFCERQLHVVLQLLYPEVMVLVHNKFTLAEMDTVAVRKQAAALKMVWDRIDDGFCAQNEHESFLSSLVGEISEDLLEQYAHAVPLESDDAMDIDENYDDLEKDKVAGLVDDEETQSEEEDNNVENTDKKRKRGNELNGSAETESDSDEAEATFSEEDRNAKKKRARAYEQLLDTSSEEDDTCAVIPSKRSLQLKRTADSVTSIQSTTAAVTKKCISNASAAPKDRRIRGFFSPGTKIIVENSSNGLLWDGVVRKCHDFGSSGLLHTKYSGVFCFVHFLGWGAEYNSWIPVEDVQKQASSKQVAALKHYKDHCVVGSDSSRSSLPAMLLNLKSCQFLLNGGKGRRCEANAIIGCMDGLQRVLSTIIPNMCSSGNSGDSSFNWGHSVVAGSSAHKDIRLLKAAMLILEASLPEKCVDNSDERWGDDDEGFTDYWRSSVIGASDASSLMECQILLEFSVRTAWLSPAGAKLLTCMPSRTHATRMATYGLVALRVFALDEAVRFELSRRQPESNGPISETEDERYDDEDWVVPAIQGSSSRQNAMQRDKTKTRQNTNKRKTKKRR